MSKINHIIGQQAFEYVRDRIADILADELDNQFQLTYDSEVNATVYVERTNPFDKTETPAVNVSLATGGFGNKNQGSVDGTYQFNIDVYTKAKTTPTKAGDKTSALRLQRLIGLCRAILEDPIYKTLGFTPPFISRVFCSEINIAQPGKDDEINMIMGRLTFNVVVNETTEYKVPTLINGYDTVVKIANTNQGYMYQGENY